MAYCNLIESLHSQCLFIGIFLQAINQVNFLVSLLITALNFERTVNLSGLVFTACCAAIPLYHYYSCGWRPVIAVSRRER